LKKLLVKGKYILTMDEKGSVVTDGAVVVENDKIIDVGPVKKIESAHNAGEVIEVENGVVMPGLVNTHNHMYGILSHCMPVVNAPSDFIGFLEDFWWPHVENVLNRQQVFAAAMMSSVEMVKTGTTCFADILEAPNAIPGALRTEAEAVEKAGLRSTLSFEATERISEENGWKGVEENLDFIRERNKRRDSSIKGMLCTHTTFTCSVDFLKKVRSLADEHDAGIHIHLEEGTYESDYCSRKYHKLPVELYEEIGFLGPDVLASQCVHTKPQETEILKKRRVKVAHMPISNCEVGGGIAPVPSYLDGGLTVGLGTDGYVQDMFKVMRAAFLVHKGFQQNASVMPADVVLGMATVDGSRCVGLEKSVGCIAVGRKADLITVDLRAPTPVTPENLMTHLVVFGDGNLVKDSVVNGRLVMKNRKVLTVDETETRKRCVEAATDLWKG
jgi:5-methylthioadenosine/S-adenosylhomocysteine deaminase